MAIHCLVKNSKKSTKQRSINKWKRQKKAQKKKSMPPQVLNVEDAHLFSVDKMKNKLRNPRNNIQITGKKRNRLTKRLKHDIREKSGMEVEVTSGKPSKGEHLTEVDMGEEADVTALQSADIEATAASSSSSKKKKRGKKKGKKASSTTNEDVEMEED